MTRIAPASRALEVLATDVESVAEEEYALLRRDREVSRVKTRTARRRAGWFLRSPP
jgi:hypothetical protein